MAPISKLPERQLKEQAGSGYESGCAGKAAYPSESAAHAALRFLQREGLLRTGDGMNVYECRYCPGWHLGH